MIKLIHKNKQMVKKDKQIMNLDIYNKNNKLNLINFYLKQIVK